MKITPHLFESFLKCPTKCWLRFIGETPSGNPYGEWVQTQAGTYRAKAASRVSANIPADGCAAPPEGRQREETHYSAENLKTAKWRLATDVPVQIELRSSRDDNAQTSSSQPASQSLLTSAATTQTCLHAVERMPSEGRGRPAQFIPIRFIFRNKLTKDDKLLLAFDAFALSEMLGREVSLGKIIHGDLRDCARSSRGDKAQTSSSQLSTLNIQPLDQSLLTSAATSQAVTQSGMDELQTGISATLGQAQPRVTKVKTAALADEVRKRLEKIAPLLASPAPPDLVLNRHCAECEFQARCRKIAIEKDDLSLLAGMSAKERQKLRSKGIFTVTQLSYTFRPRRRPKRLRDKREKYHHSLKALAIREKKIHIVGSPELKLEGTPVYLDVEGLPDRDFYYLIGVRIGHGDSAIQHSLWADTVADEGKIWREFLALLETVEQPVLIHYGRYETTFLKEMKNRHSSPQEGSVVEEAMASAINLVGVMFAQTYFPCFSNGLKEVAGWLGFKWSEGKASGTQAVVWRDNWDKKQESADKAKIITYNTEDCKALALVSSAVQGLCLTDNQPGSGLEGKQNVVCADSLKRELPYRLGNKTFALPELEEINKAAYWDYQREHVYVRSGNRVRRKLTNRPAACSRVNKVILCPPPTNCPHCNRIATNLHAMNIKTLYDLQFCRFGIKRWVTKHVSQICRCPKCNLHFGLDERFRANIKFGWNLLAYFIYQVIKLRVPQRTVTQSLNDLFGFDLNCSTVKQFKMRAAEFYKETKQEILGCIVRGTLVHVDETKANIKGKLAYVWVLTNLQEVAYIYAESREGEMVQNLLREFKGVLVSDFYAAYDSIQCPQQKCLIHLLRDLNDEVLDNPFNEELKSITKGFAELVRPMVQTVDRHGLKRHFLRKHLVSVERFYKKTIEPECQSEAAIKCKQRFEKNRDKLFTFLSYDGVPWNNNNAEHAIKAFGAIRDVIGGLSTVKGFEEYLALLTVCETCEYSGVDFLDFLRSGEKDIHAFAESRRGRRRRKPTSQPIPSPTETVPAGATSD